MFRVSVTDEEEVPLVEACVRFAYTGDLEESQRSSLPQLTALFAMADYLEMRGMMRAVAAAVQELSAFAVQPPSSAPGQQGLQLP